jgi:hypothetical protein
MSPLKNTAYYSAIDSAFTRPFLQRVVRIAQVVHLHITEERFLASNRFVSCVGCIQLHLRIRCMTNTFITRGKANHKYKIKQQIQCYLQYLQPTLPWPLKLFTVHLLPVPHCQPSLASINLPCNTR